MPTIPQGPQAIVEGPMVERRSLQKVQAHRTAQGHRAGVDVNVTPTKGGPVGHPPNPATLCDRNAQGSKS